MTISTRPVYALAQQAAEFGIVARKYRFDVVVSQVPRHQLSQHVAKSGSQRQIALLVQLLRLQARPIAVYLSPAHIAAHHEHHVGMSMIGSAIAVLFHGPAEL